MMFDNNGITLWTDNIETNTNQYSDDPRSIFYQTLSETIIIFITKDKFSNNNLLKFTYDAFFEYALARYIVESNRWMIRKKNDLIIKDFKNFMEKSHEYRPLMGAIQYLILFLENQEKKVYLDLLEILVKSEDYHNKLIAVNTIYKVKRIEPLIDMSKQLIYDDEKIVRMSIISTLIERLVR